MQCKYCDVNDAHYNLAESNQKIRDAIMDGTFAQNVIQKFSSYKEDIIEFSLWGLEPSINFDIADRVLIPLYDYFYNANRISYSTNCGLGYKPQETLINFFETYSRPITIDIQLSTDGPDWITAKTRTPVANKRVKEVAEFLEDISTKLKNVTITSHFKPTLDTHYMKYLIEDDKKFKEYFEFFRELSQNLNSRGNICFDIATPTLVLPHYHTVEDGHIFRDFLRKINKQEDQDNVYFLQTFNKYKQYISGNDNIGLCSAGLYTCSINYEGKIFGCHNLFSLDYNGKKNKSIFNAQTELGTKNKSLLIADQELIHHYWDVVYMNFTSIAIALADAGQIEKKYIDNKELFNLLIYIITGVYCPFGHLDTTKSVWIPTSSYLKLFGNGALEELIYYFEKVRKNERN